MSSPFQCRSPVFGANFYGRQDIIADILEARQASHLWVVGSRRSGKSSLLQQLKHLATTVDRYQKQYIPVYWDMQHVADEKGLHRRLVEGLDDLRLTNSEQFNRLSIDLDAARQLSVDDILHKIGFSIRQDGNTRLLILCDETEGLIKVAADNDQALSVLRYYFQCNWTQTVIAATGALWKLKETNKDVSPFLSGFVPPQYTLGRLSRQEAVSLIRSGNQPEKKMGIPAEWEEKICEITDCVPYYIQLLCKEIFDNNHLNITQILEKAFAHRDFDTILTNDLEGLNLSDKLALLYIVENPGITLEALQNYLENEQNYSDTLAATVTQLCDLCYIRQTNNDQLLIQNQFLQTWYQRNLRLLIDSEISDQLHLRHTPINYPRWFGSSILKFTKLEKLIHEYIEKQYEIEYREEAYFKIKADFQNYLKKDYTPGYNFNFIDLIEFLNRASGNAKPLQMTFGDKNDKNYWSEKKYRTNTLHIIRSIRNSMLHYPYKASREEIAAMENLCQEMINYFNREMPG